MTPGDAKAMAARIGITDLTPHDLARLAALSDAAAEVIAKLPAMPKAAPPAHVFAVPEPVA